MGGKGFKQAFPGSIFLSLPVIDPFTFLLAQMQHTADFPHAFEEPALPYQQ